MLLVSRKLADINIFVGVNFHSMAWFEILNKIALIYFAYLIDENTFAVSLFVAKIAIVYFIDRFDESNFLVAIVDHPP